MADDDDDGLYILRLENTLILEAAEMADWDAGERC